MDREYSDCKKCIHKKVCEVIGDQEGVFTCNYGDYFEPADKAERQLLDRCIECRGKSMKED